MLTSILIAVALIAIGLAAVMFLRERAARRNNLHLKAVVDHQENLTFLVNKDFQVKATNIHARQSPVAGEPDVLGNVLHCKNAHDAGRCGEHEACNSCPIRFVISKSFERGDDFSGLEACMELCGENNTTVDVDVNVEGHFVRLEQEPHMVVNVKNVTNNRGDGRPKILFISEDVRLYGKVRSALGKDFRILSADNQHQALHRLMHIADYRFCAVLTDEDFYGSYDAVTKILAKSGRLPVYVFTSKPVMATADHVRFIEESIAPAELSRRLLENVA
jgi:hypothetical protein